MTTDRAVGRFLVGYFSVLAVLSVEVCPAEGQSGGTAQTPPSRWISGHVVDDRGNALAGAMVRAHTIGHVDTAFADASGRFLMRTDIRGPLQIGAGKVEGRTLLQPEAPRATYSIAPGETLNVRLDGRRGIHLRASHVVSDPPGLPDQTLVLTPGQGFPVRLDYHLWVRWNVPQMDMHLVAGIEEQPQSLHIIGTPGTFPGTTGRATFTLTAPDTPGRYRVFLGLIPRSESSREALFPYYQQLIESDPEHRAIPLGTIVVEDPPSPPGRRP